jgi:hypothetical protein
MTRSGWPRDLPEDAAVFVDAGVTPVELAAELEALLADPQRRRDLSAAAGATASGRGFADSARALLRYLERASPSAPR